MYKLHPAHYSQAIDHLYSKCDLTNKEQDIFVAWYGQGLDRKVQFSLMYYSIIASHLGNFIAESDSFEIFLQGITSPYKFPIANFFLDIFIKADEVFDQLRDTFTKDAEITLATLMELPLLELTDMSIATLSDLIQIVTKFIVYSGAYSLDESDFLLQKLVSYISDEISILNSHEIKPVTNFDEVLVLKDITLTTFFSMLSRILFTSKMHISKDTNTRSIGLQIDNAVSALLLITQYFDDINDLSEDRKTGVKNLIQAMAQELGEDHLIKIGCKYTAKELKQYLPKTFGLVLSEVQEILALLPIPEKTLNLVIQQFLK